jgi:hypothetical protein
MTSAASGACDDACMSRRLDQGAPGDVLAAGLAGAVCSRSPSTVWSLVRGEDVLEGGRAAGAMVRALPTLSCRFICLDRVGGAGKHEERATGGMRKMLGGASVDQASDRAIAARAYDQQIERCAIQR